MESLASADEPHSHFTDLDEDVTVCDAWAIRNALVKHLSHWDPQILKQFTQWSDHKGYVFSCVYVCTYVYYTDAINTIITQVIILIIHAIVIIITLIMSFCMD